MIQKHTPEISLPEEAKGVVWRIFGTGESPLKGRSSYELIEPVLIKSKCLPAFTQKQAITEIRNWFDSSGDRHWLKSEIIEQVAFLILKGMKNDRSETAVWAVGSIEPDVAARIIRAQWRPQEFDSFMGAAFKALQKLRDKNRVLDPARCQRFVDQHSEDGKVPDNAVMRPGILETFQHLDDLGFELVNMGLQSPAGNLIDLIVDLRPDQFASLIVKLVHPVMQARAANRVVRRTRLKQHRKTLQWINPSTCDAVVALAILQTLNTVNRLDEDLRYSERNDTAHYNWSTELRPPEDDLDSAAASLITGMVERLAEFEPLRCVKWIGELLVTAPDIIHRGNNDKIPKRIRQLEKACTELLGRLFSESWTYELKDELCDGLQLTRRRTWSRHLTGIAWEIRDVEPQRAAEVSLAALDEGERQIAEQMKENRFFLHWNDWEFREWIQSLGTAISLTGDELDLPKWLSARCKELPLSAWDAEENQEAFTCADRAAQVWFLVAFFAIPYLNELGRIVDPAEVRDLADIFWNHCAFAGMYINSRPESSVVSESAARSAIEFGDPSDTWILKQARNRGVSPCALWALIQQRGQKIARDDGTTAQYGHAITAELLRITSQRFHNEWRFNLEELRFWGRLWLLLGATDESEQTAIAMASFRHNRRERDDDLLVLKLHAMVASKKELDPDIRSYARTLYRQLWPSTYTPRGERADREQIEGLFNHRKQAANS